MCPRSVRFQLINPIVTFDNPDLLPSIRVCPDVKQIYLLVRPKRGKEANQRLHDIFSNAVSALMSWKSRELIIIRKSV